MVVNSIDDNQIHPAALKVLSASIGYPRTLVSSEPCTAKQAAAALAAHAQIAKLRTALQARGLDNTGSVEARMARLFDYGIKQSLDDENDDGDDADSSGDGDDSIPLPTKRMKKTKKAPTVAKKCGQAMKAKRR